MTTGNSLPRLARRSTEGAKAGGSATISSKINN